MKKMGFFVIGVVALLSGCANNADWRHPMTAGGGEVGAVSALAECQRYAAGLEPAPEPVARMDIPAPTSYVTRGTYQQYGSNGTLYARTQAQNSFGRDFATNYNAGASLGEAMGSIARQRKINQIAADCMRSRGWIDVGAPEGELQFKQERMKAVEGSAKASTTATKEKGWRASSEDERKEAILKLYEYEASRLDGINYNNASYLRGRLIGYVNFIMSDPSYDDLSWESVLELSNVATRREIGLPN